MLILAIATAEDHVSARALADALRLTDTPHKAAADAMGVDQAQLSRWLSGVGHITTAAALRLPESARIEYFELLSHEAGAFVLPRLAVERLLTFVGVRPSPIKASLESSVGREVAPGERRKYA